VLFAVRFLFITDRFALSRREVIEIESNGEKERLMPPRR
jgi:hypothetical protein